MEQNIVLTAKQDNTQPDNLIAGRELDKLIAERVMGWVLSNAEGRVVRPDGSSFIGPIMDDWDDPNYGRYSLPPYSTDISAAWQVVEKLSALELGFAIFHYAGFSSAGFGYVAVFAKSLRPYSIEIVTLGDPTKVFHGHANNAPLAICRAALRVVGEKR